MPNKDELEKLIYFFQSKNIPYYIHAGFALYLYGLDSELDDCDIRVFHPAIEALLEELKKELAINASLRGIKKYKGGVYNNSCIEIDSLVKNGTPFDVWTIMQTICDDIGTVDFPFYKDFFNNYNLVTWGGRIARCST